MSSWHFTKLWPMPSWHGNESDPNKKVVVACFCECGTDAGLLLLVRDEGSGFDPNEIPDPTAAQLVYSNHGRGIFLMRHLMDEVRHLEGGREVEFAQAPPRALLVRCGIQER